MRSESGVGALEEWTRDVLDEDERIRLKLTSPLGVAARTVADAAAATVAELETMEEDARTLEQLERQSRLYQEDLRREFGFRLGDVDRRLHQFELRGNAFFDDVLRLGRLPDLLNQDRLQSLFERRVVADLPQEIESQVSDIIDWIVDRELRQWREIHELVGRRLAERRDGPRLQLPSGARRQQLLETLGRTASQSIESYDKARESSRLADSVKRSLAGAAALEAGAVGLGALLAAAATTTAVDVTGVLAAGALATLGLFVLPARRRSAKRELGRRLAALRAELMQGLQSEFDREVERSLLRLDEAVGPYTRFVGSRREVLEQRRATLSELDGRLDGLEARAASLRR